MTFPVKIKYIHRMGTDSSDIDWYIFELHVLVLLDDGHLSRSLHSSVEVI